ncbi:MAG: hypothetical protein ACN6PH_06490 [Pseudomonas sp.]
MTVLEALVMICRWRPAQATPGLECLRALRQMLAQDLPLHTPDARMLATHRPDLQLGMPLALRNA